MSHLHRTTTQSFTALTEDEGQPSTSMWGLFLLPARLNQVMFFQVVFIIFIYKALLMTRARIKKLLKYCFKIIYFCKWILKNYPFKCHIVGFKSFLCEICSGNKFSVKWVLIWKHLSQHKRNCGNWAPVSLRTFQHMWVPLVCSGLNLNLYLVPHSSRASGTCVCDECVHGQLQLPPTLLVIGIYIDLWLS